MNKETRRHECAATRAAWRDGAASSTLLIVAGHLVFIAVTPVLVTVIERESWTLTTKRYFRDTQMCLELTIGDVTVVRVFTKQ